MNPTLAAMPRPYNWFNQLTGVTAPDGGAPTTFAYDGNGNQVSKSDRLGTTTYAYNLDNRLVGISAPGGVTSSYEYDANGLRTKKSDSTGTRSYLLDGLSIVAEYAPDASRLAWYTQSLARIDEVLSVVNGRGKYWYETDALGSTYAMTSTAGAVVSRSSYDVFGERALVSANDVAQPFGFTGREHDQGGLVYARARYLNSIQGRWTQPDPLGFVDGPSRYRYVKNEPTRLTDPSGLFHWDIHESVTAAAFAGVLSGLDLAVVMNAASRDADAAINQFDDYRHGMRAKGASLADGVRAWVDFVDSQLALGATWSNSRCGELHEIGLRELAYGVHAAEDYYAPPHHMQMMDWTREGIARHGAAESGISPESGPARQALEVAGHFAQAFRWIRRFPSSDATTARSLAWAVLGNVLFIDATTGE